MKEYPCLAQRLYGAATTHTVFAFIIVTNIVDDVMVGAQVHSRSLSFGFSFRSSLLLSLCHFPRVLLGLDGLIYRWWASI